MHPRTKRTWKGALIGLVLGAIWFSIKELILDADIRGEAMRTSYAIAYFAGLLFVPTMVGALFGMLTYRRKPIPRTRPPQ